VKVGNADGAAVFLQCLKKQQTVEITHLVPLKGNYCLPCL